MRIDDYLEQVNKALTTSVIISYEIEFEVKSSSLALIYGEILFKDSSILEFLELIRESQEGLDRLRYRFQYRREENIVFSC